MKEGKNGAEWMKIGQTERVTNNLNPDFSQQIETLYFFEKEQHLRFEVYDIDLSSKERDFIGRFETTMGKIMGANKQTVVADLEMDSAHTNRGKIVVRLNCVNTNNDDLIFKFKANLIPKTGFLCCRGSNNPYYVISRARDSTGQDFMRVFESSHLNDTTEPNFKVEKLKLTKVCNGDKELPIRISLYSKIPQATDLLYGEMETTVSKLLIGGARSYEITAQGRREGTLIVDKIETFERPPFTDYLRSGWGINTSFAIDFTASNGEIFERDSLHFQHKEPGKLNQYEQAILGIGQVI